MEQAGSFRPRHYSQRTTYSSAEKAVVWSLNSIDLPQFNKKYRLSFPTCFPPPAAQTLTLRMYRAKRMMPNIWLYTSDIFSPSCLRFHVLLLFLPIIFLTPTAYLIPRLNLKATLRAPRQHTRGILFLKAQRRRHPCRCLSTMANLSRFNVLGKTHKYFANLPKKEKEKGIKVLKTRASKKKKIE